MFFIYKIIVLKFLHIISYEKNTKTKVSSSNHP